jgi:MinD-like ATPase involved in chromosome partitioning or flagellar assembly
MLITMVSGKASPGVTTATWALALGWPSPVLAVDADPGGGDMAAGLLFGRAPVDRGLLTWAAASRRTSAVEAAAMIASHVVVMPEAPHVWLLPGVQHAGQAAAMDPASWDRIALALEREAASRDVLVDCGRLGEASAWPLIRAAERVVMMCRRSGRSIHAARNAAALVRGRMGDLARVRLLVVDQAGPYEAAAIASELSIPLLGELPADRRTAEMLSDGAAAGLLGARRSKLIKSTRGVIGKLMQAEPRVRPAAGVAG